MAVFERLSQSGFVVDMGPFSTTASGELDELVASLGDVVAAGFAAGATSIQTRIETA